jgi:hypothetical protein
VGTRLSDLYGDVNARIAALEDAVESSVGIPSPIEWAEDVSRSILDPWQGDYLLDSARDVLMRNARQTGKSQSVSLKSAFRAKYLGRYVAVLAPTLRQSSIIYRRANLWLDRDQTDYSRKTAIEIEIATGGSIAALPGDRPDLSIRGDTVDDLIVDEASRIKDSLIVAATPATATRGDATITYLSTPAGKRGAFWTAWDQEPWWHRITITADQCPRISEHFLAREKKRLGHLYAQEYGCEFLDAPGGLFLSEDLAAVFGISHVHGMEDGVSVKQVEPIW